MPYLMVLLYREIPDCSRHKKGEASDSIRQIYCSEVEKIIVKMTKFKFLFGG